MNYIKKQVNIVKKSFAFDTRFPALIFIDVMLYVVLASMLFVLHKVGFSLLGKVTAINPADISQATIAQFKSFFVSITVFLVVSFVLFTLIYAVARAFTWRVILKKKVTKKSVLSFIFFSLLWNLGVFVVMLFFLFGLRDVFATIGMGVMLVLVSYLTMIAHYFLAKTLRIRAALAKTFSTGVRIHTFIVPIIIAILIFYVYSQLWRVLPQSTNTAYALFVLVLFMTPFFVWLKLYFNKLLALV
jgi:hypothetical protein